MLADDGRYGHDVIYVGGVFEAKRQSHPQHRKQAQRRFQAAQHMPLEKLKPEFNPRSAGILPA
jgi:hypothetical protein